MSYWTSNLGDGSLFKHLKMTQNWCPICIGMSYKTSILRYGYYLRHQTWAHKGEIVFFDNPYDLGRHIRQWSWEMDLFWNIGQEHKIDVPYDLGHHIAHQFCDMYIFWDMVEEHMREGKKKKMTCDMIWDII
jgi:hypothetical protein